MVERQRGRDKDKRGPGSRNEREINLLTTKREKVVNFPSLKKTTSPSLSPSLTVTAPLGPPLRHTYAERDDG